MKTIITNARTRLRSRISYVKDANVFVSENEIMLPDSVTFPAIGIKDGGVKHVTDYQDGEKIEMRLNVTAYVQNHKSEENIMAAHGVLSVVDDIITALNNNTLDISGVYLAVVESETESKTLFNDRAEMVQMKTVTFRYEKLQDY